MERLIITDLNVLEDVSLEEMNQLKGAANSASTAAANIFGVTSAGGSSNDTNVLAFSGLPQPAPNPAPFSAAVTGDIVPTLPTFN